MLRLWQRPILVGGLGLSASLWMLQGLQHSAAQLGEGLVLGLMAVGLIFWIRQQGETPVQQSQVTPANRELVEKAIASVETAITQFTHEVQTPDQNAEIAHWRETLTQLQTEFTREQLNLAIIGGKNTGKTSLYNLLKDCLPFTCTEIPALFVASHDDQAEQSLLRTIQSFDLTLFLVNGDLTASEYQVLQTLRATNQRVILVWNKQDLTLPTEQPVVLEKLRHHGVELLAREDVMAIATVPQPLKVRQHQVDGSYKEWVEQPEPNITLLINHVSEILTTEVQQLVLETIRRKADNLKFDVKQALNQVRRDRALPIIEQSQWIAAATAFANPVPALDLLATGAITGQLVMDLGAIYQQKFDLKQAQMIAGTLGSLMLKLGFVELSTQSITHLLKTNAVTYIAGGLTQGISAAYLTRVAGLSLIEYFQSQDIQEDQALNFVRLGETLKQVFQDNQRTAFLQGFIQQVVKHLFPNSQLNLKSSSV